jgi:phosphoserine phosphatase
MRPGMVTFDIDGTLTIGHGWYYIAGMLGRGKDYLNSTRLYRSGRIGEGEHLNNLLNLAAGRTVDDIAGILEKVPLIDNISEGITQLKDEGFGTYLLTHNPEYVCTWYARRFGFDGYMCSAQKVDGKTILRAESAAPDKLAWLDRFCLGRGLRQEKILHIGDSASDRRVFIRTGLGIAVNTRDRSVISSATAHLNTTDMNDIVEKVLEISDSAELLSEI